MVKSTYEGRVNNVNNGTATLKLEGLEKEIVMASSGLKAGQEVVLSRVRRRTRLPTFEYDVYALQEDGQQKYVRTIEPIPGVLK